MTRDQELWAFASEVLRIHGNQAPRHVAERIGALALAGEADGIALWKEVALRIDRLSSAVSRQ